MPDLKACIRGDKDAWDAFVERYTGLVVTAVRRTVAGQGACGGSQHPNARSAGYLWHGVQGGQDAHAEIEDLVQDVFLRLLKDDRRLLKTYDASRASLSTWLTLVARSVTIDRLRARRLSVHSLELGHVAQAPAAPASAADEGPDLPLHILTGRQRLVLRLLFDEGRTVTEAAAMLAVDEQTIRSTKHKALSRLREHFERESSAPIAGDAGRRDAV